jgi:hypothetical protein
VLLPLFQNCCHACIQIWIYNKKYGTEGVTSERFVKIALKKPDCQHQACQQKKNQLVHGWKNKLSLDKSWTHSLNWLSALHVPTKEPISYRITR